MRLRFPVVLASGSPRRRELLGTLVPDFDIVVPDVDETLLPGETPRAATMRLATAKARAVLAHRPHALVIGGDTLVALPNGEGWEILGKPRDEGEAHRMLRSLSGREHMVTTGISIANPVGEVGFADETRVTFRELSDSEIQAYVATGESLDKAGGYAIQGVASAFILKIVGSRSNVVGLPLEKLEEALSAL